MRQLLILGFYCEVYRREPRCRVYANDILLDEFDIPHIPIINKREKKIQLDPTCWASEQFDLESNPPFLKCLELDDAGERSVDIRVEIQNDDNNYANGFMTQHSRVMLRQCWLASVKVWEEFEQIQNRWKFSRKNRQNSTNNIAQYYSGRRIYVFDNLIRYANMHFPDVKQQPMADQQIKEVICHRQYMPQMPQMWEDNPGEYWVGSSGYYLLTLIKKLGFWRHSTDRRRGFWKLSMIKNIRNLYDKYKQYEDTRSIDQ